jgi:hypothetical protein
MMARRDIFVVLTRTDYTVITGRWGRDVEPKLHSLDRLIRPEMRIMVDNHRGSEPVQHGGEDGYLLQRIRLCLFNYSSNYFEKLDDGTAVHYLASA